MFSQVIYGDSGVQQVIKFQMYGNTWVTFCAILDQITQTMTCL